MLKNELMIKSKLKKIMEEDEFSGVVHMKKNDEDVLLMAAGYADRANEVPNKIDTKFGIASGCKIFTAVAICQLIESGVLSFESLLSDCLQYEFPNFDTNITVHDLLTHTAGIPDYFDEAVMDNFEDLWKEQPMYLLSNLKDFLPLFQNKHMMADREKFHYNNAGFILLGLIVEQMSGQSFSSYVETTIFNKCKMYDSGYFSLDQLPKNSATGYIDGKDGTWRTNIYSIPIQGGADGGAYVNATDMNKFWKGLFNCTLLSESITKMILTPHVHVKQEIYYGYGIWIKKKGNEIFKYHVMGYDPGVSFHSGVYPKGGVELSITSNRSDGAYSIMKMIEEELLGNMD